MILKFNILICIYSKLSNPLDLRNLLTAASAIPLDLTNPESTNVIPFFVNDGSSPLYD